MSHTPLPLGGAQTQKENSLSGQMQAGLRSTGVQMREGHGVGFRGTEFTRLNGVAKPPEGQIGRREPRVQRPRSRAASGHCLGAREG
jgi:hypothetical protein